MPGPQDRPAIVVNMTDYPALRDKKAVKLIRLQPNHYKLVLRRFDANTGAPATPDELPLSREGAEAFAKGLEQENEQLQKAIESNKTAIGNLRTALISDMDALDAAALKEGDI